MLIPTIALEPVAVEAVKLPTMLLETVAVPPAMLIPLTVLPAVIPLRSETYFLATVVVEPLQNDSRH